MSGEPTFGYEISRRRGKLIKTPVERREMGWTQTGSEVGRTYIRGVCPFCLRRVHAFLWSLCGCGKRCGCGALLLSTCAQINTPDADRRHAEAQR